MYAPFYIKKRNRYWNYKIPFESFTFWPIELNRINKFFNLNNFQMEVTFHIDLPWLTDKVFFWLCRIQCKIKLLQPSISFHAKSSWIHTYPIFVEMWWEHLDTIQYIVKTIFRGLINPLCFLSCYSIYKTCVFQYSCEPCVRVDGLS